MDLSFTHGLFGLMSAVCASLYAQNALLRNRNRDLTHNQTELERTSRTDPLTGLQNRATITVAPPGGTLVSGVVAVLDMDDFKRVNDELGHLAGDEVLREVGRLIRASVRGGDLAFRWGGDEFVLVLQNETEETATTRLLQIEARLEEFHLRGFGPLPMRVSWGVAEAHGSRLHDLVALADEQMYSMKRDRKRTRVQYTESNEPVTTHEARRRTQPGN
ncbi:MAG: GGDEF domain-containing protein [Bryobacterales bacterium]|nr:GGDEF domain-containing protein [Bryobacterales bacterium]